MDETQELYALIGRLYTENYRLRMVLKQSQDHINKQNEELEKSRSTIKDFHQRVVVEDHAGPTNLNSKSNK